MAVVVIAWFDARRARLAERSAELERMRPHNELVLAFVDVGQAAIRALNEAAQIFAHGDDAEVEEALGELNVRMDELQKVWRFLAETPTTSADLRLRAQGLLRRLYFSTPVDWNGTNAEILIPEALNRRVDLQQITDELQGCLRKLTPDAEKHLLIWRPFHF